jgi:hypothetical protein
MHEMRFTSESPSFGFADGFTGGAKFVLANRLSSPAGREIAAGFPMAGYAEDDGDRSKLGLHCEHGAKAGLPLRNTVVGPRGLRQGVGLDNRLNFTLRDKIQGFI